MNNITITKTITVQKSAKKAFDLFVNKVNWWWPKEYTWSQEALVEIKIEPKVDGLCTEIGPYNFRCDWGRVIEFEEAQKISFTWQISPDRVPEPDPSNASKVLLTFKEHSTNNITIQLVHCDFENHGKHADEYYKAMNSEMGWDYILKCYTKFCNKNFKTTVNNGY